MIILDIITSILCVGKIEGTMKNKVESIVRRGEDKLENVNGRQEFPSM